jgi:hypothetical protein
MIDFPGSPTLGDTHTASGVTYTFDGVKWVGSVAAPSPAPTPLMEVPQRIISDPGNAWWVPPAEYIESSVTRYLVTSADHGLVFFLGDTYYDEDLTAWAGANGYVRLAAGVPEGVLVTFYRYHPNYSGYISQEKDEFDDPLVTIIGPRSNRVEAGSDWVVLAQGPCYALSLGGDTWRLFGFVEYD